MFKFLVPAIALALAPMTANAGLESTESYVSDAFEVAGLKLGMQPDQVMTEMETRGYTLREEGSYTERGPSFDEMVKIVSGDLSEGSASASWKQMTFDNGTEEGVNVKFKPLPTGTAVYAIIYANMAPAMTKERFMPAVETKYGAPRFTANGGGSKIWSDEKLVGEAANIWKGAVKLEARDGAPDGGGYMFQQVKGSLQLTGGKVGLAKPEDMAKNWTEEPKTTF